MKSISNKAVIEANNEFAFKFFHATLRLDEAENNKLVSPLSIYLALSMLYNGAAGATRDAIHKTLQLAGIPISQLNAVSRDLLQQLPAADPKVQLSIANSIWYSQSWPEPLASFLEANREYYNGLIQSLDFSDPAAAKTINNWVAESTGNKIPSIIAKTDITDLIYLVNAIYFNATWLYPFEPHDTSTSFFHLANGGKVSVPFMSQTRAFAVWQGPSFTLAELPYGSGQAYSMYVVLPEGQQQGSIKQFVTSFDPAQLRGAISKLQNIRVRLILPRWEYAYAIDNMQPQLTGLGMGKVFSDADFTAMYPPDLPTELSRAIHKTYIKVGELGTEAAAATVIGVRAGSAPMAEPPRIKLDRPFLYLILEKNTGAILFMGTVSDPSQK